MVQYNKIIHAANNIWREIKMLKKNSKSAVYISILLLVYVIGTFITYQGTYTKKKTITIEKGKTYKLKCGKGCIYKSTKPKVVSVSKKGLLKAKKIGKCVVRVKKGKKIIKYHVTVKKVNDANTNSNNVSNISDDNISNTPNPTGEGTLQNDINKVTPGNYWMITGLQIIDIIQKTDEVITIRLQRENAGTYIPYIPSEATYVELDAKTANVTRLAIGDNVYVSNTFGSSQFETKGNVCHITNFPYIGHM